MREFYFDSRREMRQMTDAEYADALAGLAGERRIAAVVVDPSAASFLELLRREVPFFSLKLRYEGERLAYAALNGREMER